MFTQVHEYKNKDTRAKILEACKLLEPIPGTMSPKGENVLFRNEYAKVESSNDGHRIAQMIQSKDPVVDVILDVIKNGSTKTNMEAGDATSTTILLSVLMIKEGLKLVDEGWKPMDIKKEMMRFKEAIIKELLKQAITVKTDDDIRNVAAISANNDQSIAKDILQTVKVAGLDGMVFLEPNNKPYTEIIEDLGFNVGHGMFAPDFRNHPQRFSASYSKVPLLVTDKRIYYKQEAETILGTVMSAGHKAVVIIARDFIGEAVNVFKANHGKEFQVLLVKDANATDKDSSSLEDLVAYTGGKLISEKNGSLVDKLTMEDFVFVDKVFSDPVKTLITSSLSKNKSCKNRVAAIRAELKKDKDNKDLKRRLASLTNGMVTLRIGAPTEIETKEKLYRYEDAINATRAAMRDGFLVGGGTALRNAYKALKFSSEFGSIFKKFCEANLYQILKNCGEHEKTVIAKIDSATSKNVGYNALKGEVEDLLEAGVVDAYKAVEMAVSNSISVASEIVSSNFIIVPDLDEGEEIIKDKKKK